MTTNGVNGHDPILPHRSALTPAPKHGKKLGKKFAYKHYGLALYLAHDGNEYAVGSNAQAHKAAKEYILDSLWTFNANFIANIAGLDNQEERTVRKMQEEMSESANPLIRRIVGEKNLGRLVREAIAANGLGHFLSPYDGHKRDSSTIPGLPKGKLAFRTN